MSCACHKVDDMDTIYKFPFEITDMQEIEMPMAAQIIHVGLDPSGTPCLWAEVDPTAPATHRKIAVIGTGNPLDFGHDYTSARHLGSLVQGPFVWHVYEVN
jgi:hypothetical protein